jgi:hypothetical protein
MKATVCSVVCIRVIFPPSFVVRLRDVLEFFAD